MRELAFRLEIIEALEQLHARGLNPGRNATVSARIEGGFLISPASADVEQLDPSDMCSMTLSGQRIGSKAPASDWLMHRDLYFNRSDVAAVLHTQSTYATALATLSKGIPPFHYTIAMLGGKDIRCAPYALFGSQKLSDLVVQGLRERKATLVAQNGLVTVGASVLQAAGNANIVENLAQMYVAARQLGEPALLNDEEIRRVIVRFADLARAQESGSIVSELQPPAAQVVTLRAAAR